MNFAVPNRQIFPKQPQVFLFFLGGGLNVLLTQPPLPEVQLGWTMCALLHLKFLAFKEMTCVMGFKHTFPPLCYPRYIARCFFVCMLTRVVQTWQRIAIFLPTLQTKPIAIFTISKFLQFKNFTAHLVTLKFAAKILPRIFYLKILTISFRV